MKAVEFDRHVGDASQIEIPSHLAGQIPNGAPVRVILLFDSDEADWACVGAEGFAAAYCEQDSVYEPRTRQEVRSI